MQHFKMTLMYFMNGQFVGSWSLISPSESCSVYTLDQFIIRYYLNGINIDSVESQK